MKTLMIWAITLILTGFVVINILAYHHARAMLEYVPGGNRTASPEQLRGWRKLKTLLTGVTLPRPEADIYPDSLGLSYETIRIPVSNEITLDAWYIPAPNATTTALLFHGYQCSKSFLLEETMLFHQMGVSTLLVDFRGSGNSTESYTTIGYDEADDVSAVFAYAHDKWPDQKLLLFGQSMGAAAILRAIAIDKIQPDAIILEAVFDNLLATIRNRFHSMRVPSFPSAELLIFWAGMQYDINGFTHNPVEYAKQVTCPTLMMHGRDDPRAKLKEAKKVYTAIPEGLNKKLVVFDNTGHESYATADPARWRNQVQRFLAVVRSDK